MTDRVYTVGHHVYRFFPELGTYALCFFGPITIPEIIDVVKEVTKQEVFIPQMNSIIDFRKACLIMDQDAVQNYVNFSKSKPELSGDRKIALLTTTPQQTTYSMIFQTLMRGLPVRVDIFSTLEAVLEWEGISREHYNTINTFLIEGGLKS